VGVSSRKLSGLSAATSVKTPKLPLAECRRRPVSARVLAVPALLRLGLGLANCGDRLQYRFKRPALFLHLDGLSRLPVASIQNHSRRSELHCPAGPSRHS
jgi:hypothetical protein